MESFLTENIVVKIMAVNAALGCIAVLIKTFASPDNKIASFIQKLVDLVSANIKHN